MNVMFKLVADAAAALGDGYDAEVVEVHHRNKQDAPSGTALRLGEAIAFARGTRLSRVGRFVRQGMIGARAAGEIGIQSLRAGDVVGEHTVLFAGVGERIELTHHAHSRDNFARGALLAARWVVHQKPGLYTMMDVLNLR
jgi:4-hydroxy-tetrahydrodipicolinate reductase